MRIFAVDEPGSTVPDFRPRGRTPCVKWCKLVTVVGREAWQWVSGLKDWGWVILWPQIPVTSFRIRAAFGRLGGVLLRVKQDNWKGLKLEDAREP